VRVFLTDRHYALTLKVAARRENWANRRGAKHRHNWKGQLTGIVMHKQGCRTELATALALKLKWNIFARNINAHTPDVGENIQVRGTNWRDGHLLMHPSDCDDHIFVLGISEDSAPQVVDLVGYIGGVEGKQKKYWGDKFHKGRPAFCVPQSDLRPFEDLLPQTKPVEVAPPQKIAEVTAACGSVHCDGCYDVGDGRKIHPPKHRKL